MHKHIYLMGDSIFDNGSYVEDGDPAVIDQLNTLLDGEGKAVLLAVDGHTVEDVFGELDRLRDCLLEQAFDEDGMSMVVLSVGGNDALHCEHILYQSDDQLLRLGYEVRGFEHNYGELLRRLQRLGVPVVACTIYEGDLPMATPMDRAAKLVAHTGLGVFNDVIIRQAARHGIPVLDLRRVCHLPEHYANPIEPSAKGGEQIARAILSIANELADQPSRQDGGTVIYGAAQV